MDHSDMSLFLGKLLPSAPTRYAEPSEKDWRELERQVHFVFPTEFKDFTACVTAFEYPGDLLNASAELPNNGNDTIALTYREECASGPIPSWFVPFLGIGNGDFVGFDSRAHSRGQVVYWYHERLEVSPLYRTFNGWLEHLDEFVS